MSDDIDFAIAEGPEFGKCTALCKTMLPESTDETLTFLAHAMGMPKAEYVRMVLMEHAHGKAMLVRSRIQRGQTRPL